MNQVTKVRVHFSGNRRSQSVGSSFHSDLDASDYHQATNESALFHTISSKNKERNPILSRALNDQRKRNSRSIGPKSGHTNKTIKRDLRTQNVRPSSAGNRNPNKSKDLDFNLLPESGDYANSSYNDFSCNHRYHDPLNQTQILDDNFHAAFTDNYSTSSFQRADEICRNLTTAKRNVPLYNFYESRFLNKLFYTNSFVCRDIQGIDHSHTTQRHKGLLIGSTIVIILGCSITPNIYGN